MADVLAQPAGRAEPTTTGYGQAYNVAALFEAGHPAAALALVRRYWGSMLERGATTFWESFDPDEPRATELDLHGPATASRGATGGRARSRASSRPTCSASACASPADGG
jgi:hypothetical protein